MALDLRVAVNKAVVDLRREISKKTSDLASLNSELTRYQKVQGILNNQSGATRIKANRKVRRKQVDWNSVLKQLPGSFAVGNVANLAKIKSRNYMHHVLARWIKQRKVKRVEPGKYQKL
jgi:predicted metalloprotease with PDZ domain